MSEVLVLVEHANGVAKKVTLELLTLARRLGEPSAVILGGAGAGSVAGSLAEYGAVKVYVGESDDLVDYLVAPKAEVLATLVQSTGAAGLLIASTPEGKEIAARVAVKTGSGLITDAVDVTVGVSDEFIATQNIYGGAVVVQSQVSKGTPVITVRPNSTAPAAAPAAGTVEQLTISVSEAAKSARIIDRVAQKKSGRPELTEASVVVSGGRGLGAPEHFSVVEALADELGAAVGASRAATDAGWYPHQFQVGQTGKTVSPQLYVAVGISGAIQHRAGMQTSKTIVAVNKDREAPIFELADFGVVGDLFNVVPQATEELKKRKG